MSYLTSITNFFCAPSRPIEVDYSQVIYYIEDKPKAEKVAVLLRYLFTNTISKMTTSDGSVKVDYTTNTNTFSSTTDISDNSLAVEIEHTLNKYRKLPGHNTLLYVPPKVKFTVYKDGRIQFKDPSMAPYEMVELLSYYVWNHVDILNDKVHVGSSHSVSLYFKIADLGNTSTEIPYSSILDALDP